MEIRVEKGGVIYVFNSQEHATGFSACCDQGGIRQASTCAEQWHCVLKETVKVKKSGFER